MDRKEMAEQMARALRADTEEKAKDKKMNGTDKDKMCNEADYSGDIKNDEFNDLNGKMLIELAYEARENAYAPYSHFQVGAALLAKSGKIYTGCNIENASYGASNCAERTAFFKAVSAGENSFSAIAVVGGREGERSGEPCPPCGICRQVMREFCSPEKFLIILEDGEGGCNSYLLEELLPFGFGPENLDKEQ